MKKFKQFRGEQKYITEVGPYATAMMSAMAIFGLGAAGFKLFKAGKEKIKGYRETKAEKKANRESGVEIEVKKINPDTGEEYEELVTLSGSDANLDADGVEKKRKELQKKYDNMGKGKDKASANEKIRAELGKGPDDIITKDDKKKGMDLLKKAQEPEEPETDEPETPDEPEEPDDESGPERDKETGNLVKQSDAQAAFEKGDFKQAPDGWTKDPADEKKVIKPEDIPKKPKKKIGTGSAGARTGMAGRTNPKDLKKAGVESRLLKFGEYISEDVMSDLLKATKSKKDSEITLDDGTDIPIDPLTSQILVKYIEGLSSSEKNRTIQQIQRTERAFMKVLGKAHEG